MINKVLPGQEGGSLDKSGSLLVGLNKYIYEIFVSVFCAMDLLSSVKSASIQSKANFLSIFGGGENMYGGSVKHIWRQSRNIYEKGVQKYIFYVFLIWLGVNCKRFGNYLENLNAYILT